MQQTKHLKTSIRDLRRVFTHGITIRDIATPLASFDIDTPLEAVRRFMEECDYDVVGIRRQGVVAGFVERESLRGGTLADHFESLADNPERILPDSEPLSSAVAVLSKRSWQLVQIMDQVVAIITRGDLQKMPVRMWLFAVVSLIEMHMLRLIRERFPENEWVAKGLLKSNRIESAKALHKELTRKNEEIDLACCLQFCDKRDLMCADRELLRCAAFERPTDSKSLLEQLEKLRNALAHAQPLGQGGWPELSGKVERTLCLLNTLEEATATRLD